MLYTADKGSSDLSFWAVAKEIVSGITFWYIHVIL